MSSGCAFKDDAKQIKEAPCIFWAACSFCISDAVTQRIYTAVKTAPNGN